MITITERKLQTYLYSLIIITPNTKYDCGFRHIFRQKLVRSLFGQYVRRPLIRLHFSGAHFFWDPFVWGPFVRGAHLSGAHLSGGPICPGPIRSGAYLSENQWFWLILKKTRRILVTVNTPQFRWRNTRHMKLKVLSTFVP